MRRTSSILIGIVLAVLLTVTGCRNPIDTTALNSLAKSDVDKMADTSLQEMNRLMEDLLVKLYKRNPDQLAVKPGMTVEGRLAQFRVARGQLDFAELDGLQGIDRQTLAAQPRFCLRPRIGNLRRPQQVPNDDTVSQSGAEEREQPAGRSTGTERRACGRRHHQHR